MKPVIYQLVVRYFGNTNLTRQKYGGIAANGCGKFSDISTVALQSLRELGVTHIWLTGCLRHATLTDYDEENLPADDPDIVKGMAGSFYAIRDYFDVCPDYANVPSNRMTEFEDLVSRMHSANLSVLLDFVPNHVARSYHSVIRPELDFGLNDDQSQFFLPTNDFFYIGAPGEPLHLSHPNLWAPPNKYFDGGFEPEDGATGRRPKVTGSGSINANPNENDWYETIKLNYGFNFTAGTGSYQPLPRTWGIMDEVISYWQQKGVDGFRCDMSHLVPPQFWSFLISRARARRQDAYFLAEAYFGGDSQAPVQRMSELVACGFNAIYDDESFDALRRLYLFGEPRTAYDHQLAFPPITREQLLAYLENHDELRIPAPIQGAEPENSGFGSVDAGYQLAPLQFLRSAGPVLLLNGQEVGEPGSNGGEGWPIRFGQTTFFDYWAMPEFARWVNDHTYNESELTQKQRTLRRFYAALLALCQDPAILSTGFWGLEYYNNSGCSFERLSDLFSFARYVPNSGRVLVVVANFRLGTGTKGRIALPLELIAAANLNDPLVIALVLNRSGEVNVTLNTLTVQNLQNNGFEVSVPNQTAHVYSISCE